MKLLIDPKPIYLFLLLSLFLIVFAWLSFDGYYFYDDYSYAYYANQVLEGEFKFSTQDIFAHRFGIILPLALLYAVFGISDFTNILLPILASLWSIFLLFKFTNIFFTDNYTKNLALAFGGLDFYILFFSNKLYPDVLLTSLALGAVWFLLKRKDGLLPAFYFVGLNFWAFLTKELIIYFLPFYIFVFFTDLRKKNFVKFWLYTFFLTLFFTIIYCAIYYLFTDNFLFRFSLIQDNHYTVSFSYFDKPFIFTLHRITYEPIIMFVNTHIWIVLAGIFVVTFSKQLPLHLQNIRLLLWGAFAFFWFLSTSVQYYNPIGLFPRHILFLLPFAALLTAWIIGQNQQKDKIFLLICWALAGVYAFKFLGIKNTLPYLMLAVLLGFHLWRSSSKSYILLLFLGILLLHPIYTMLKPTETGYKDEKFIVKKYLSNLPKTSIIFTDDKLFSGYLWYYDFKKPENITYKDLKDYHLSKIYTENIYFLLNMHSIRYFEQIGYPFPDFVHQKPKSWKKIAQSGEVILYKY
ncbi:MAG: hypothetical protein SFU27_12385 [Thermonemataceae bacterium]|nr:hypothetical protein [Thermonemataceae bacterium]